VISLIKILADPYDRQSIRDRRNEMVRLNEIRVNEVVVDAPDPHDAGLTFIGRIRTPWTSRLETPRQGRPDGPVCTIEIFEPWVLALQGVERFERLEVLYWLDQSRRDLVLQSPASNGEVFGTFSIRSPVRPNPIGTSIVLLEKVEGNRLYVRGLDCIDGTPLLDLKPERSLFKPIAPPQPGDFETGPKHHCQKA
jgi:tRNA-Thr(GGU) m(6)t(6)A37 methyltransferase TsaA